MNLRMINNFKIYIFGCVCMCTMHQLQNHSFPFVFAHCVAIPFWPTPKNEHDVRKPSTENRPCSRTFATFEWIFSLHNTLCTHPSDSRKRRWKNVIKTMKLNIGTHWRGILFFRETSCLFFIFENHKLSIYFVCDWRIQYIALDSHTTNTNEHLMRVALFPIFHYSLDPPKCHLI